MPEDIRKLYVAQLKLIVPESTEVFLLTTEDAEENVSAHGVDEEINALYSECFDIDLAHVESVFEPDPQSASPEPIRTEYKLYRLSNRTDS